jgi:N-acetylglucosamine-6-phosphate deacetylase
MLARADAARAAPADAQAEILGVHLEGPFLGDAPGAHDPALLATVDVDWLERVVRGRPGLLRVVTLAPEADPGLAGTRTLVAHGVVVALGHSAASYEECVCATDAGASVVTHVFNGMSTFHHRAPGLVGAALTDDRLTPTIIADLVHVHPAALRLATRCRPGLASVSDAVAVVEGVVERAGAAWLADGTLAGATTLLDGALANLVTAGVPLVRAVESVTAAPARAIGADGRGMLRPGARADVVALDPRTLAVLAVWLGGAPVASD